VATFILASYINDNMQDKSRNARANRSGRRREKSIAYEGNPKAVATVGSVAVTKDASPPADGSPRVLPEAALVRESGPPPPAAAPPADDPPAQDPQIQEIPSRPADALEMERAAAQPEEGVASQVDEFELSGSPHIELESVESPNPVGESPAEAPVATSHSKAGPAAESDCVEAPQVETADAASQPAEAAVRSDESFPTLPSVEGPSRAEELPAEELVAELQSESAMQPVEESSAEEFVAALQSETAVQTEAALAAELPPSSPEAGTPTGIAESFRTVEEPPAQEPSTEGPFATQPETVDPPVQESGAEEFVAAVQSETAVQSEAKSAAEPPLFQPLAATAALALAQSSSVVEESAAEEPVAAPQPESVAPPEAEPIAELPSPPHVAVRPAQGEPAQEPRPHQSQAQEHQGNGPPVKKPEAPPPPVD
jgi:hypothetical protein